MIKIIEITFVEPRFDKEGKKYYRTHAVLEDGDEVIGYSKRRTYFQVGDKVMRFFHRDVGKMSKK